MKLIRNLAGALGAAALVAFAAPASAQSYPTGTIRIVVPFGPGGASDLMARSFAAPLEEILGQAVIVENIPGANGVAGVAAVAGAPADGYTIGVGTNSTHALNPGLYSNLPYDPVGDFQPLTQVHNNVFSLLVNPQLPVRTVAELVEYAKARPGELNIGGGTTNGQLAATEFMRQAGIDMLYVNYSSETAAMQDLVAGRTHVQFASSSAARPLIDAGTVVPIATTGTKPSNLLPDLPSIAESGYPDFLITAWMGMFLPDGTPAEIVTTLSDAFDKVLQDPRVVQVVSAGGAEIVNSRPDAFAQFLAEELDRWANAIEAAGIEKQ